MRAFRAGVPWNFVLHSWAILDSHDSPRFRTMAGSEDRQIVGVGLQMTTPGVPMVFAGDELGLEGEWGRATVLVIWGALAIGLVDNLLYPFLVGSRLRLHPLPVFISIVGGISLFGGRGSILGTLFGAMIVGVVSMGLNMLGADPQWKVLLTGVLIIAAVAIDQWIRKVSV
jgi:hypothetical protein